MLSRNGLFGKALDKRCRFDIIKVWKPRTVATSNLNPQSVSRNYLHNAVSRLVGQTAYFFFRARTSKTIVRISPTMLAILPRSLSNVVPASFREGFPAGLGTHLQSAGAGLQATVCEPFPPRIGRAVGFHSSYDNRSGWMFQSKLPINDKKDAGVPASFVHFSARKCISVGKAHSRAASYFKMLAF